MTTGERIKAARQAVGLTQEELGKRLGISGSSIAQYEMGHRKPKIETLNRIAAALGEAPWELVGDWHPDGSGEMQRPKTCKYDDEWGRIAAALGRLNADGRQKAVERVEELTEVRRYLTFDAREEADQRAADIDG